MVTGSTVEYNLGDGREECEDASGFAVMEEEQHWHWFDST